MINTDTNEEQQIIQDVMYKMLGTLADKYNTFTEDMRDTNSMGISDAVMTAEYYQQLIDGTLN